MTTPYESDESGNLVNGFLQEQFKTRRDTKGPNLKYFKVQAFGRSLHLKVTEAKPQISLGAMVQTVDDNGSSTYKEIPRGVYYSGHVVSDPGSLVAINGNKGLVSDKLSGNVNWEHNASKRNCIFDLCVLILSEAFQAHIHCEFCPKGTTIFAKFAIDYSRQQDLKLNVCRGHQRIKSLQMV